MGTGTITEQGSLVGSIYEIIAPLDGSLSASASLEGSLSTELGGGGDIPIYHGPYEVTPKAHNAVTLNTAGKQLTNNVNVTKIPTYETGNIGGGYTFIIAED